MENRSSQERPLAVSIARAAQLTSLCQRTIRNYALAGKVATVRCGRRIIIPFEALEGLVKFGVEAKSNEKENKR
jgi:hypothetical protein